MIEFENVYDFYYKMSEEERVALVGQCFQENGRNSLYFPLQLTPEEFNYDFEQGLLFVTPVYPVRKPQNTYANPQQRAATRKRLSKRQRSEEAKKVVENYFLIGVKSPDDLDLRLIFAHHETHLRPEVVEFLQKTDKVFVTYLEVLERIRDHFQAGTID